MTMIQLKQTRLEVERINVSPSAHASKRSPIVFLHEGLGSVAMWRSRQGFWPEQVCHATGRHGVVYSRRGYGQSDSVPDVRGLNRLPPDYMHREAWDVLPELLKLLGIEQPVLLGHSDGGTIALLHAARHPLSACLVMAPHVMVEEVSIHAIEAAREAYVSGDLRGRLSKFHRDVDAAFWQWNDVWLSEGFRSFDIRNVCHDIRSPVLALHGVDDAYGTLRQIEDIAPQHGHITRHALADCGHSPHKDQAQTTLALVANFLADMP
ncbi:alpha/beta fold hydrolase [Limnohabitans sp.]|uniref:alpha/beta fold hydrolase n=1 Tax=Limnohabitans sp. TaxID=1907725 RepID=UPI0038B93179